MRIDHPPVSPLPGIRLVQLEKSHAAAWYAILSIPKVVEHTSWNISSATDLELLIDGYLSPQTESSCTMAILDTQNGNLIGTIGFHSMSAANRSAEIAYTLAPDHWHKGIATALCKAVTEWGFDHLGLIRVCASVLETNLASACVLEKCSFQYEGYLRAFRQVRGRSGNFKLYARLNTD